MEKDGVENERTKGTKPSINSCCVVEIMHAQSHVKTNWKLLLVVVNVYFSERNRSNCLIRNTPPVSSKSQDGCQR